ncbi:MAG: hypothetical protein PQJ61_07885 [Spirochaetales bacterium]|uniref:Uncharacterized protein n=1 Tax=Candidatus Thalassospirochaeta sargassi TaxID=3119039 RepID=A0AAJ1MMH0_9SPIO|nr:hypothetical protein [Spirochaetales bacterium]
MNYEMKKDIHASIRLGEDLYNPLQQEAERKYEGNMSLLIRMILKEHISKSEANKAEV